MFVLSTKQRKRSISFFKWLGKCNLQKKSVPALYERDRKKGRKGRMVGETERCQF